MLVIVPFGVSYNRKRTQRAMRTHSQAEKDLDDFLVLFQPTERPTAMLCSEEEKLVFLLPDYFLQWTENHTPRFTPAATKCFFKTVLNSSKLSSAATISRSSYPGLDSTIPAEWSVTGRTSLGTWFLQVNDCMVDKGQVTCQPEQPKFLEDYVARCDGLSSSSSPSIN